jgi:predicted dehydrogenase
MNPIVQWGIIGCGNVTEVKSGPAFNKANNSKLVAVMRRDASKAADYAFRHKVPSWYSSAIELIEDPQVNAVYIATPPAYHEEYALHALKCGKPVYVEKPVTISLDSLSRMQEAVDQYQGKLTVAHYRRAVPLFVKIKELIDEGAIGKIKLIQLEMYQSIETDLIANSESNWRINPALSGGGLFYDLAPHQLDIIVHIFGAPLDFSGYSVNQSKAYSAEDSVTGTMLLPNEILFQGNWNFSMPSTMKKDSCRIIGENGSIEFAFFGNHITIDRKGETQNIEFQHPMHIQQPMIEKVVDYFLDKGSNPCSLSDAGQSFQVMEEFVYGDKKFNALKFKLL